MAEIVYFTSWPIYEDKIHQLTMLATGDDDKDTEDLCRHGAALGFRYLVVEKWKSNTSSNLRSPNGDDIFRLHTRLSSVGIEL